MIRGIVGCFVGCLLSVALTYIFDFPSGMSFIVGIGCGVVCTGIALNV